jgi:hypothetical protein
MDIAAELFRRNTHVTAGDNQSRASRPWLTRCVSDRLLLCPPTWRAPARLLPMAQDAVFGNGGGVFARGTDEHARAQRFQSDLDRAFGKSGSFRNQAQAGGDGLPSLPLRFAVKMKVNQKCRRLVIVADQVAHQDIEDVVVDWDGFMETRHHPDS